MGGAWMGDGHPGGGEQRESREEMMERGAREMTGGSRVDQPEGGARGKTGGIWRRRSQERPRPQPRWRPTVEPTEGGAMVEEGLTTPGGRPTAAEQVVVEPEAEMESR
ncbi:hypothetical protein QQF64_013004 [Cirrhinus molitorella]|uniref:Uncharacterized protein n=1 Tax=Cirrhinus molitorella TaxID=172907 RepID=A0ABR3LU11_9TELE